MAKDWEYLTIILSCGEIHNAFTLKNEQGATIDHAASPAELATFLAASKFAMGYERTFGYAFCYQVIHIAGITSTAKAEQSRVVSDDIPF